VRHRVGGSRLFLVADDLTGALDAAARFATPDAPVAVHWRRPDRRSEGGIALDAATRELGPVRARRRLAELLAGPSHDPDRLLYAKLDSLLRGNAAAEIAVWLEAVAPRRCVIAPAFPFQGRVTRAGRQFFARDGAWIPTATDLLADLRRLGVAVDLRRPGEAVPEGVSLWDAETEADLERIAAAVETIDSTTLWCGSGGLAAALAAREGVGRAPVGDLARPILGFFGTDHPVTRDQLAACAEVGLGVSASDAATVDRVAALLAGPGCALVRPELPVALARAEAARRIEGLFGDLAARLMPPATLIVAGGETLHGLCRALGVDRLRLEGELMPGVPVSRMSGGRFDGVRVVSKSGAFGTPDLLLRLTAASVPSL
jgi:uncharacterized protein YgbK (DUF1537 family)